MKVIERYKMWWAVMALAVIAIPPVFSILGILGRGGYYYDGDLSYFAANFLIPTLYPIVAMIFTLAIVIFAVFRLEQLLKAEKEFEDFTLTAEQKFEKAVDEAVKAGVQQADIKRIVVERMKKQE